MSGDLGWRTARGEAGKISSITNAHVFRVPSLNEVCLTFEQIFVPVVQCVLLTIFVDVNS